ncbi:MAG: alkaline phosphatase family protein [Anaerolineaceae bacterium]
MKISKRILHFAVITIVNVITLLLLTVFMKDFQIQSIEGAIGVALVYVFAQVIYWWLFIDFFSRFPVWLYPLITFLLAGGILLILGNLLSGIWIMGMNTAIWIIMILTSVNTILGSLLSLDIDSIIDRHITQKFIHRVGKVTETSVPGFLFLQIDGLSEKVLRQALNRGDMPTLKRWLDAGTHQLTGWETDFTSQTGAMQAGILLGNNEDIPAYRWWDRQQGRIIKVGDPRDAEAIESRLSGGNGLLSLGGASCGNLFSGDSSESLFTFSTLLNPKRKTGPGYYLFLVNPFLIARLGTRFLICVLKEWWQAWRQRKRGDSYTVNSRNFFYAFLRAAAGPFLQDLTTDIVISDELRGIPAIYNLYVGYDDIAHYAGMEAPESYATLAEIDRYIARIERTLKAAPRPYHIVVLSDHGQSTGPTFETAYGITLEHLVEGLIDPANPVYAAANASEAWDYINTFLNESINTESRMVKVLRTMLRSRTRGGVVSLGPDQKPEAIEKEKSKIENAQMIVLASGCTGLIYFTHAGQRITYEEIQSRYPELILGLLEHPGIGFVLVHSAETGAMVLGKGGIYFLDNDLVEGENPLANYSAHAPALLRRESNFPNCPDIIVNTTYHPETQELCSFENQVSHHGGLGGPQNHPFLLFPRQLPLADKPIVGAESIYQIFSGWRRAIQHPDETFRSGSDANENTQPQPTG